MLKLSSGGIDIFSLPKTIYLTAEWKPVESGGRIPHVSELKESLCP